MLTFSEKSMVLAIFVTIGVAWYDPSVSFIAGLSKECAEDEPLSVYSTDVTGHVANPLLTTEFIKNHVSTPPRSFVCVVIGLLLTSKGKFTTIVAGLADRTPH